MRPIENRLREEEPWFTLRAQDVLAPYAVVAYANLLRAAAGGLRHGDQVLVSQDLATVKRLTDHAAEAEAVAAEMVAWQAKNPDFVKLPD